jgi:serine phosphatase RsbU (regulator of sigma subunit)
VSTVPGRGRRVDGGPAETAREAHDRVLSPRPDPTAGRANAGEVVDAVVPVGDDAGLLGATLDALPDGVLVFDGDWTVRHANAAATELFGRARGELVGRSIWTALPAIGGSILHSFLLHARSAGERVTWRGYAVPVGRWIEASALRVDDLLHVQVRATSPAAAEGGPPVAASLPDPAETTRLRFLAEVSESLISTLDTGESMAQLVRLVVPRLCDWAMVLVADDDGQPLDAAWWHRDPARREDLETYVHRRDRSAGADDSPMAAALLTGEPVHLDSIPAELIEPALTNDEVRAAWERLDAGSVTIVPLRARGETFGALGMVNDRGRASQTEMEVATAVEVARRASLALDNARLYGSQLQVAETLQRSLLTPPPQPDDLEICVRYQPATGNMHVGGDWYDAFQQPDGATLLVIGDVVGHDVDAAAAMGQVRTLVRGIAFDRQESPARVLERVDGALTGLRFGTLATALVARLEQDAEHRARGERLLRWASAGHLPPLLLRAAGGVEFLVTEPEMLLGAEFERPRTDATVTVQPGDTLLFYTDGLVEHGRTGIDAGLVRLAAAAGERAGAPVQELCDGLLAGIVGDRADDDVAIVAVRCHPQD